MKDISEMLGSLDENLVKAIGTALAVLVALVVIVFVLTRKPDPRGRGRMPKVTADLSKGSTWTEEEGHVVRRSTRVANKRADSPEAVKGTPSKRTPSASKDSAATRAASPGYARGTAESVTPSKGKASAAANSDQDSEDFETIGKRVRRTPRV